MASAKNPGPSTDVLDAIHLLLWARRERVAIAELSVGNVRLSVVDLQLAGGPPRVPDRSDADSLYRQYGGAVIDKVRREIADDDTFEDDDEVDEGPGEPQARGKGGAVRAPRRR